MPAHAFRSAVIFDLTRNHVSLAAFMFETERSGARTGAFPRRTGNGIRQFSNLKFGEVSREAAPRRSGYLR
jgi:hypothetical protein